MSYFRIPSGANLVLNVLLGDGATNKYPLAYVYKDDFSQILGSPFALAHMSQGLYSDLSVSVPDGRYVVVYVIYDDAGHITASLRYNRSTDTFDVNDIVDVNAISEGVWRETLTGNVPAGSFGEAALGCITAAALIAPTKSNTDTMVSRLTATRAGNLDNLDAQISSRATPSQAATAVWDEIQSGHTSAGSFGKYIDAAVSSRESEVSAASRYTDDMNAHLTTQAFVSQTSLDATAIKNKTDLITFTGPNVNANSQVVADKSGYALSVAGNNAVSDTVWDESLAAHVVAGSTAAGLALAATDVGALANAVWDEPRADHAAVGTYGESLQGILSVTRAVKLDNLDVAVSSRESEASANSRALVDNGAHSATQAGLVAISSTLGSPVANVSADIAAIKVQTNKIGNPVVSLASDLASLEGDLTLIGNDIFNITALVNTVDSKTTAVKAKTDQLTFTGPNVNSNVQVMGDKTGYEITNTQEGRIVDLVWDELTAGHVAAGSLGKAVQDAAAGANPAAVADAVWDELAASHSVGGSFSDLIQGIRSAETDTLNELASASYGLAQIRAAVTNEAATTNATLATHTTKLNAIPGAIIASENNVIAEVNANEVKIDAVIPAVNAAKIATIAEINANEIKIDAVQTSVGSLSNNTTVRFIVPERLIKPTVGSKNYQFHLRLFDDLGNPEAPDSAPTIRIRRLDTGVDVVAGAAMTQDGIKVGAYYYDYPVAISSFVAPILVEATLIEGGVTKFIPSTSEITEFETDLTALSAQVSAVDTKVISVDSRLLDPVYGLSALQLGQVGIVSEINANEAKIDAVKAKTDTIPNNPATTTETSAIIAAVATKPSLADITVPINLARDSIKGADARDNTVVYDHFDIASVAKTADPRFDNLDAAISTRSTLTAAQVWANATRTMTSFTLQPTDVQAIWDYLSGGSVVAGSVGKLLHDTLDAKISTRATSADITTPLIGVAQEATVNAGFGAITNEVNANEVLINSAITKINQVIAKTTNLPTDPASQSAISSAIAAIAIVLADTFSNTSAIKASTDNLPVDPAKESTVAPIPHNPLLANDLRVDNLIKLDVPVSSVTPPDISNLAEKSDVTASTTSVNNNVDLCRTSVASVQNTSNLIKLKTDNLPASPAAVSDVNAARDATIARIDANGVPLTASAVWANPVRTITQDPASFGPDISLLAEKSDLDVLARAQYANKMSTIFSSITGNQEVIVWAEKNGLRVIGANATITVKDSLGVIRWSASLPTPNADGIFRFENSFSAPISQNYYIVIDITVDAIVRTSVQSFFTVV